MGAMNDEAKLPGLALVRKAPAMVGLSVKREVLCDDIENEILFDSYFKRVVK